MTNTMLAADRETMKRFIWRKTYPAGDSFIWANGGDGPIGVFVTPIGDDPRTGIDIDIATNEPDAVRLRDVYDYYRTQDMIWEEWSRNIMAEVIERRHAELLADVRDVLQRLAKYAGEAPQSISVRKPRISVDTVGGTIVVDDTTFSGIDCESCLIVKVLVEARGNWVSRREMQESEPHLQLVARIDRKIDYLQENHKAVGGLIERQSKGFRIRPQMFC